MLPPTDRNLTARPTKTVKPTRRRQTRHFTQLDQVTQLVGARDADPGPEHHARLATSRRSTTSGVTPPVVASRKTPPRRSPGSAAQQATFHLIAFNEGVRRCNTTGVERVRAPRTED